VAAPTKLATSPRDDSDVVSSDAGHAISYMWMKAGWGPRKRVMIDEGELWKRVGAKRTSWKGELGSLKSEIL